LKNFSKDKSIFLLCRFNQQKYDNDIVAGILMITLQNMARILAIDYGAKRTGIAVTDELQIIASGLTTVLTIDLMSFLKDYIEKEKVELFVIGEPKQMNNQNSEIEVSIKKFIQQLTQTIPNIPIERVDERFTSIIAVKSMIESGLKKNKRRDKYVVDEISATLILQSFLAKK